MSGQTCRACGGRQFTLTDGFMYCDVCGSMLENFEELEEDASCPNIGIARIRTTKTKKSKDKVINEQDDDNEEEVEKKKTVMSEAEKMREKSKFFTQPSTSAEQIVPLESSPDYLYRAGIRLSTFAQLLHRCSKILIKDLNMPPDYTNACLALFQKYLEHCEVAFCDKELIDDENQRLVVFLENKNFEKEEAARKKKKIEERKSKGLKTLGQSTAAWQLLTQGNLDENLAMSDNEDEEEEEVDESTILDETRDMTGYLKKITTFLSKEAVKRSSQILLNLEFLATILLSAALSVGCQNICLSDVVRWIREDRFRISRKEIILCSRGGYEKWRAKDDQGESHSYLDFHETALKYPLYEIDRIFVLFQQSLRISEFLEEPKFEKLAARFIENFNLPSDLLRRVLILHDLIPCDLSVDSIRQANFKHGFNLRQLTAMKPKCTYDALMQCFGIRENFSYDSTEEEVLLCPEVKVLAYLLFALKMTIDLDTKHVLKKDENDHIFEIDTYLQQLEMRVKCWQGHDMSLVLRQSAKVPELAAKMPFGDNFHPHFQSWDTGNARFRRQHGFRQCIPQDMSFESTHLLPTVFKTRQNSQDDSFFLPEATLSPLKYQKRVCRREMQENPENFENCDEESIETFNKSFRDLKIVENTNSDFSSIFPASSKYLKYGRPDRTSKCVTRKTRGNNTTIHRIYLSLQSIQDLFLCAEDSISGRFLFLLKSFALTIGEDFRALYAAFIMLETLFLEPERVHKMHNEFLNNEPVTLDYERYRKSGNYRAMRIGVTNEKPIASIEELDMFQFSKPIRCLSETIDEVSSESDEDADESVNYAALLRNLRLQQNPTSNKELRLIRHGYDFDTIFAILALKCW